MRASKFIDPDLGPVDLGPPPTREEGARLDRRMAESDRRKGRLWPDGARRKCPSCGRVSLVGRSDLSVSVPRLGGVETFRNLRGAACARCGAQVLEPWEQAAIDEALARAPVGDHEVKVSRIGRGTVGTYWPKDVVRVMGLKPDRRALVKVLDERTMVLVFQEGRRRRRAAPDPESP